MTVERLWDFLGSTIFWGAVPLLATLAITWWRRPRRGFSAAITSQVLVSHSVSKIPNLSVQYADHPIRNLSVSTLQVWNSGSQAIRQADLDELPEYRLRVEVCDEGAGILHIETVRVSQMSSQLALELSADGRRAEFSLRYLEPKQGAVFRLYHTGGSGRRLTIAGTIIDVPVRVVFDVAAATLRVQRAMLWTMISGMVFVYLFFLLVAWVTEDGKRIPVMLVGASVIIVMTYLAEAYQPGTGVPTTLTRNRDEA